HSSNYYAPTLTYTLSLHDALPISSLRRAQAERCKPQGNRKLRPLRLSACGLELLLTLWQSAIATVSLLYGMRRAVCVTGWLMVGALAAPCLVGQAALTPADSAILNSQPLKRLVLAPSLLRRLSLLAAGLDREVVLCLQGTVVGDTALVREFAMPDIVHSSVDAVTPLPCPPATTLAVWHNHPWV